MKKGILLCLIFVGFGLHAQINSPNFHKKNFKISDTLQIDSVSISHVLFKFLNFSGKEIDTSNYKIDFSKAQLILKQTNSLKGDSIQIQYLSYPKFLTKKYTQFNSKLIVPNGSTETELYSLTTNQQNKTENPFDGLYAAGSITRGLTVGNNQNAVVNSTLDLQLAGKLSDKVTLKASIIDTNLPIQENGNTYKLNEFDRVFIELSSQNWSVNAGDIYLNNTQTSYLNFNKKVSGLQVTAHIKNKNSELNVLTSGALVKGKYKKIQFNGLEGNQGPYKLYDANSNTYILILSGSEQIYVNGILLKRGEENDYTINYNTAELTFNTNFPITADMRISAEYQYTDRVYTRFITYNNIDYKTSKFKLSSYFYNESDLKNQPLEQDLTDEQKQLLANAGNNTSLMIVPSAVRDTFSQTKILYKKLINGIQEIYEYSTDSLAELYAVTFLYVGTNLGSYQFKEATANGKIYEYVGENLGSYSPVKQLIPPTKLQLLAFKTSYNPSEKTLLTAETAFSNADSNMFSTLDQQNNKGFAGNFGINQVIFDKNWRLSNSSKFEYIGSNFKTVERVQPIEFNRDWNINFVSGNQQQFSSAFILSNKKNTQINYKFEQLQFGNYKGNKQSFFGKVQQKSLNLNFDGSYLKNNSDTENGNFLRYFLNSTYRFKNSWLGFLTNAETNKQQTINNQFTNLSHKFTEYEAFYGVGDSAKVYAQIGAILRTTDSVKGLAFERVNSSRTFYLKSKLIQSKSADLSAYVNYRTVKNVFSANEQSLNSSLLYKQTLFNQFLSFNTNYQTLSGTLPQQDYTYLKTEPGQGFYTWIDYNNNGIQELNEFEIAQFADQATYLRIMLPTVNYIPTYENKFSQSLILNPQQWITQNGFKKAVSHFYNQTSVLVDSKRKKLGTTFNLNPFNLATNNMLSLNYNVSNSIYFNRAKQHYSTSYTYIKSENKSTTTIDFLTTNLKINQLQFEHKLTKFWVFSFDINQSNNSVTSANYLNRNFEIKATSYAPKLSYYLNNSNYFSFEFEQKHKKNEIGNFETLSLTKLGTEVNYTGKKNLLVKASLNIFNNKYNGNANSPVGYQLLEGLQPGKNYTWTLLFEQRLNSFINLSLNYLGRKSETSKTVHTGSIQLKAFF